MDDDVTQSTRESTLPSLPNGTGLCKHLAELVLFYDMSGQICYASPAACQHSPNPRVGQAFTVLLVPDALQKGLDFFAAACSARRHQPTTPWELALGDSSAYAIATFRGYQDRGFVVLLGQVEPAHVGKMQQELLDLTSDLTDAQRQLHRQNQALQQALDEQYRLLQTIQELSAPIAPVPDDILLLPLIGHIDSYRADRMTAAILEQVAARRARSVILDITGMVTG